MPDVPFALTPKIATQDVVFHVDGPTGICVNCGLRADPGGRPVSCDEAISKPVRHRWPEEMPGIPAGTAAENRSLREQAKALVALAHALLTQAGTPERLLDLAANAHFFQQGVVDEDGFETYFSCAVCGPSDNLSLTLKHPASGYPYRFALEVTISSSHANAGFFDRLWAGFRALGHILAGHPNELTVFIANSDDLTRLKDVLKRL